MHFKLISALAFVAVASAQCDTGSLLCCQSVQSANTPVVSYALGLVGAVVQDTSVQVGLTCSPLSVLGFGGNTCASQPVCCSNNNFSGLIAIGCTPTNLNL